MRETTALQSHRPGAGTRRLLAAILILTALSAAPLAADAGVGIILGEPTGISFRMDNFPILGLAWSFNGLLHVHADYWFVDRPLTDDEYFAPMDWYLGAGGKVIIFSDSFSDDPPPWKDKNDEFDGTEIAVGLRIPVGVQYFPIPEIELFLEVVPGMLLFPATSFDLDAGIGARYIFRQ